MNDELNPDPQHLKTQIRQIREVITALENEENSGLGMESEELWPLIKMNLDDNEPIYPRLAQMIYGYADVESVQRGLERMENDLSDLESSEEGIRSLYQEQKNNIDAPFDKSSDGFAEQPESNTDESEQQQNAEKENAETSNELRDKNQLPLNADYGDNL